jgi:Amidohydrolase family
MAERVLIDRSVRVRGAHSMVEPGLVYRSLGLRGAEIAAVSSEPDGLDHLVSAGTVVVDARDLTLLPAFADAHEHLMEASRNTMLVPVDRAQSVSEFTAMVRDAAATAAPGEWILTSMAWHESNLAENRMPTGAELDVVAPNNPVLARRGGHLAVAIRSRSRRPAATAVPVTAWWCDRSPPRRPAQRTRGGRSGVSDRRVRTAHDSRRAGPRSIPPDRHVSTASPPVAARSRRRAWLTSSAMTKDPLTIVVDNLADLVPVVTVVGGEATHDPEGRLDG